jgi:hypothetical protein
LGRAVTVSERKGGSDHFTDQKRKGSGMTSRAVKRARKRNRISLPHGEVAITPQRQGRRTDIVPDARKETLSTRAKQCGQPDTPEGRDAVSGPQYGCAVGRAIMQGDKAERVDLWEAVKHMRRVWIAYDRAIGAPSRHAKCLAILAPTDAMTADAASPAPDLRTEDDIYRQAIGAYMRLRGWLGYVEGAAQSTVIRAVVDEPDDEVRDWATIRRALLCVVDGIKGRRMVFRGV